VNGWSTEPLGAICTIGIGKTPSRDRSEYWGPECPWLSIADMNQGRDLLTTKETITPRAVQETNMKRVEPGTVLLSFKLSVGKVGIAQTPMYTNEAIARLPIRDNYRVLPEYLYWALQSIDLTRTADRAAKGVTLNKAKLEEVGIPVPPLPEQRRIAAILDQADALRAKRRTAIAQLDTLAQSIFLDMFGDPRLNPCNWQQQHLIDICTSVSDIDHKMPSAVDGGVPMISAKDLRDDGTIALDGAKQISEDDFARLSRKGRPRRGDIIYSRIGTVGKARIVKTDARFLASYSCCTIKPSPDHVDAVFLRQLLDSPSTLAQAVGGVRAIGVPDLGLGVIKQFVMIVPPLALQREFAQRHAALEGIRDHQTASHSHLDQLFTSLQHRAFRGEL